MSEFSERYRKVADAFTARVEAVPPERWDDPSPCEGWVARDIVRHLTTWLPDFFFERWGIAPPDLPSVDDDPVAAWKALDATFAAALDDPEIAGAEREVPFGTSTFEATLNMICTGDLLIHTWDLARATGGDERLDPEEMRNGILELESMGDVLEQSGHYGPRVAVPDGADDQTRFLALTGRRA